MATSGKRGQLPIEEVERRAYELYLERGGEDGRDLEDWVRAEDEIAAQLEAKGLETKRTAEPIGVRAEDRDAPKSFENRPLTKQAGR